MFLKSKFGQKNPIKNGQFFFEETLNLIASFTLVCPKSLNFLH
jgi:hypothetical protein